MKQYLLIIIICIYTFFSTGCTNNLTLKKNEILEIKFDNLILLKEDYSDIISLLNKLNFSKRDVNTKFNHKLLLSTKNDFYQVSLSDKNIISYTKKHITYYSSNKNTIKKLRNKLSKIKQRYKDKSFYKINYTTNYTENNSDKIIKIDHVNQYFKLKSEIPIIELKIHKVEKKENIYQDIDLVYQTENIQKNKTIVIRMNPQKDYFKYRITFKNKYGFTTSIIPTYDIEKENGELKYIIDYSD